MESELSFYVPLIYGLMVCIGLIGCFFGFKLFRLMLVIVMAFSCGVLGGWLGFSLSMEPLIWSAVGLALGAVIGGVLAFFFYSVGVGILGALFVCASLMPYLQTLDPSLQAAVLLVCGLVAAYAAVSVTNLAIQLVTAMLGAFLAVQGVLFFLQGRVSESWIPGTTTWELDLIFTPLAGLAALVLGAVGFFFQRRAATS